MSQNLIRSPDFGSSVMLALMHAASRMPFMSPSTGSQAPKKATSYDRARLERADAKRARKRAKRAALNGAT